MKIKLIHPVPFVKMHGAGNDFIIIDHREPFLQQNEMAEFARLACRRAFSVGADGLFFIEKSARCDFKWQFFNSDGSVAEMCGNGARCVARYAYLHGIASADMTFETLAGIIEARVSGHQVVVKLTPPSSLQLNNSITIDSEKYLVHSVNTGVPHAVLFTDTLHKADIIHLGAAIRYHELFSPAGTNVNLVKIEDSVVSIRTYERGVEAETKACGTGATAAAIISVVTGKVSLPVTLKTIGGERLTVAFDITGDNIISNVTLKGNAVLVYKGELSPEALTEPE